MVGGEACFELVPQRERRERRAAEQHQRRRRVKERPFVLLHGPRDHQRDHNRHQVHWLYNEKKRGAGNRVAEKNEKLEMGRHRDVFWMCVCNGRSGRQQQRRHTNVKMCHHRRGRSPELPLANGLLVRERHVGEGGAALPVRQCDLARERKRKPQERQEPDRTQKINVWCDSGRKRRAIIGAA